MFNKKIILGVLSIGMLAVVAAAGTFAYFDSSQSATGSVSAGTLTLGTPTITQAFSVSNTQPGDGADTTTGVASISTAVTGGIHTIVVDNSINGKLVITPSISDTNANMHFYLVVTGPTGAAVTAPGLPGELTDDTPITITNIPSGTYTFTIKYGYTNILTADQNSEQGAVSDIDMNYHLVQA